MYVTCKQKHVCTQTGGAGVISENVDPQMCSAQPAGWRKEPAQRENKEAKRRERSKLQRTERILLGHEAEQARLQLVQTGQTRLHLGSWPCWGETPTLAMWCQEPTRLEQLVLCQDTDTDADSAICGGSGTIFPPRYCLKCFYKYLNSCSQPSEVLVMSVIQRFLQQRKEKQMRSVIFFAPTFPSCHAHVRLGDLLQQVFSTPALDEYFQAASEPDDTRSTYFLLQQIALRKPPLKTLYLSTDDVEQLLTCTTL